MTKFFEPINVSATHIYHSALELSPISSIVRKLYYDRCHGVTRFLRVVIGTPDSWNTTISISVKQGYGSCTWSPCGQFIAAQTGEMVEIRNSLTFELLTVLKSTKSTLLSTSPLVYSPDGRSLACGLSGGIVIWDIQTGGVANEISCNKGVASLAWSLDGGMVAITLNNGVFITDVETYNVFSGALLFSKQYESKACIYLWAQEKSFRLMEAVPHELRPDMFTPLSLTCTISEIGATLGLVEIKSSSLITGGPYSGAVSEITFSPSTYHIATLDSTISVYDIRTSHCLFQEYDFTSSSFQFSPDGSHFAYFHKDSLYVFQFTSDGYTLLWRSPFPRAGTSSLQFSPTSSSIVSQHGGVLQVRRLSDLSIVSKTRCQYMVISRSGRSIATAHDQKTRITIIDLHTQAPSQFIDTGVHVERLAITGNVLVVMGLEGAAGWLLTKEGMVDGVSDNRTFGRSDSKWTHPLPVLSMESCLWNLRVEGEVGVIQVGDYSQPPLFYHIETGNVLELTAEPQHEPSPEITTGGGLHHHLHYRTLSHHALKTAGQFRAAQRQRQRG